MDCLFLIHDTRLHNLLAMVLYRRCHFGDGTNQRQNKWMPQCFRETTRREASIFTPTFGFGPNHLRCLLGPCHYWTRPNLGYNSVWSMPTKLKHSSPKFCCLFLSSFPDYSIWIFVHFARGYFSHPITVSQAAKPAEPKWQYQYVPLRIQWHNHGRQHAWVRRGTFLSREKQKKWISMLFFV